MIRDCAEEPITQLLAEQQAYYVERAPEYDEWWERKGRYDLGSEGNQIWWREVAEVMRFFAACKPRGKTLDIAAGTGNWTEFLARYADTVTALDGSEEVLEINRRRLITSGLIEQVEYQQVDLFAWSPTKRYGRDLHGILDFPHSQRPHGSIFDSTIDRPRSQRQGPVHRQSTTLR